MERKVKEDLIKQAVDYEKNKVNRKDLFSIQQEITMLDQQIDFSVLREKKIIRKYIRNLLTSMWKTYLELFLKSETYRNFKNILNLGGYLKEIPNRKLRFACSKIRRQPNNRKMTPF